MYGYAHINGHLFDKIEPFYLEYLCVWVEMKNKFKTQTSGQVNGQLDPAVPSGDVIQKTFEDSGWTDYIEGLSASISGLGRSYTIESTIIFHHWIK